MGSRQPGPTTHPFFHLSRVISIWLKLYLTVFRALPHCHRALLAQVIKNIGSRQPGPATQPFLHLSGVICIWLKLYLTVSKAPHTVLFSEVTLWQKYTSNLSAWLARGRSGPHVERIWANPSQPFLRKVHFKNRCFTIKSALKFQNLEKIWKKFGIFFSYIFGI